MCLRRSSATPRLCICRLARFAITSCVFADGKCLEYRQVDIAPPRKDFDYIFELPASVFEGVAAGLIDLIDAGLKGKVKITGDMRILIRHAELVNVLYERVCARGRNDLAEGQTWRRRGRAFNCGRAMSE